ncbi:hypothetical protein SAMN05421639_10545 [Chryseobacterium shigense]|uniref:Uncharacterized protein n=1 Tax=Chryseobacterium shigense TaxID=297244 RepID=A0A1N7J3C1_9FLAO|nr:hypothetical protein [Chryseobacterium shigense]SIS43862.1 hypothetical protein SAMN05421639_10545 [Chryseobacterium shigense]
MIEIILMLLGLAFSNNTANTATCNNNQGEATAQLINLGEDSDPGTGGPIGGNTGQLPPPPSNNP